VSKGSPWTIGLQKGYRMLNELIEGSEQTLISRQKDDLALMVFKIIRADVNRNAALGEKGKEVPESFETPIGKAAREKAENQARMQYQPTQEEFINRVKQLKAQGQERAARKYYDRWKKTLWPD